MSCAAAFRCFVAAVVCAVSVGARGDSVDVGFDVDVGLVDAAEDALQNGDPEGAAAALEPLTTRGPWRHATLVRVWRLLGTARAFSGDVDGAERAFVEVLLLEPQHVLPYTASPKVTFAFERARAAVPKQRATHVDVVVPGVGALGAPLVAQLRVDDAARRITSVVIDSSLGRRVVDVSADERASERAGERAVELGVVDEAAVHEDKDGHRVVVVDLVVVGRDAQGSERFVGAKTSSTVSFDAPTAWWQQPQVWIPVVAGGVVVAGVGGAALVVAALPPDNVPLQARVRR